VKDDIFTFNKDNTYTHDEGPEKCDSSDPQTNISSWSWNSDETILTIDSVTGPIVLTILKNDGITLKGSYTAVYGGSTQEFTITWTKQ